MILDKFSLNGKVAIVTGGDTGLYRQRYGAWTRLFQSFR